MRLTAKTYKNNRILQSATVTIEDESLSFREQLEQGLVEVCSLMNSTVPIWMKKNTYQLAAIQRVTFERDQFMDDKDLRFDKMELALE